MSGCVWITQPASGRARYAARCSGSSLVGRCVESRAAPFSSTRTISPGVRFRSERAAGVARKSPFPRRALTLPLVPVTRRRSHGISRNSERSLHAGPSRGSPSVSATTRGEAPPRANLRRMIDSTHLGRVVVAEAFDQRGIAVLERAGIDVVSCVGLSRDRLDEALRDARRLIVRSETRVDGALLKSAALGSGCPRRRRRRCDRRRCGDRRRYRGRQYSQRQYHRGDRAHVCRFACDDASRPASARVRPCVALGSQTICRARTIRQDARHRGARTNRQQRRRAGARVRDARHRARSIRAGVARERARRRFGGARRLAALRRRRNAPRSADAADAARRLERTRSHECAITRR